ncbi:MAG: GAF domain-containing protein [Anaerolineae bacterium]|nr:GAF domain-containing protein [Anaerolineae bacterium]
MLTRIRHLISTPSFEDDKDRTSQARLLSWVLWIVWGAIVLFYMAQILTGQVVTPLVTVLTLITMLVTLGLRVLLHAGRIEWVGVILSGVLWLAFTLAAYQFGGTHDTAIVGYFVVVILAGITSGGQVLLWFAGLVSLTVFMLYVLELQGIVNPVIPPALNDLFLILIVIVAAALLLRYALQRVAAASVEARQSSKVLADVNMTLEERSARLEVQTQRLSRRARNLQVIADVTRVATELSGELEQLLDTVVKLVGENLDLYHVAIYRVDESGRRFSMQASSSELGQALMAREVFYSPGDGSYVGQVVAQAAPVVRQRAEASDAAWQDPDYPDTWFNVGLPLRSRGEIIGVLDIHSMDRDAFLDEDILVLQTLADQIAVSISNAELFAQLQRSLEAERRAYGELSQASWRALLTSRRQLAYRFTQSGDVAAMEGPGNAPDQDLGDLPEMTVPLIARGGVIGQLRARKAQTGQDWTEAEQTLLRTLVEQLALTLESARSYQDTQDRAFRERLISTVASRLRASLDLETTLKIAVAEMRRALGLKDLIIRLIPPGEGPAERDTD